MGAKAAGMYEKFEVFRRHMQCEQCKNLDVN